jgi:hypothetical protein
MTGDVKPPPKDESFTLFAKAIEDYNIFLLGESELLSSMIVL